MVCLQLIIPSLLTLVILGIEAAYNNIVYDPRYMIRRVPVRRSVDFESRIQAPLTRYFPQVDAQVAQYPYMAPQEAVAPAAYRLPSGEVYVLPSRWSDEAIPAQQTDLNDYAAYDYEEPSPIYGRAYQSEPYEAQQDAVEIPDNEAGDMYNDMMVNYFLTGLRPELDGNEFAQVQRRSQEVPNTYSMEQSHQQHPVDEQNNSGSQNQAIPSSSEVPAAPESSTAIPVIEAAPPVAPAVPASTQQPAKTRPAAPVQRFSQFSMVRRSQTAPSQTSEQVSSYESTQQQQQQGQKEYPFYRQATSVDAKKSAMAALEEQMSRVKNSGNKELKKNALSILEKMMAENHFSDPITKQLENLKFQNM